MAQAIITKFIAATATKGNRIRAKCQAGSLFVEWRDDLDMVGNHRAAALALLHKLQWPGVWRLGALPDGSGYAVVRNDVMNEIRT